MADFKKRTMEYEAVVGLEVHVQLRTRSKAFSRSRCSYGEEPNGATDPVVLGLPGALPVLNREAVLQCIRAGLMFGSQISRITSWDRKNYFYPDSPKNYQITQQARPICVGGTVEIELPGRARNIQGEHRFIRLNRIHLEEDVGKLTHEDGHSLIDFNRAGTPLAEIVTEPDLRSAEEAAACLNSIRMYLAHAEVSPCDMEKGQMRCDVNVSLRPMGSDELGTRVELKNLNSISAVRHAIDQEILRQGRILRANGTILQETRRWDAVRNCSDGMRRKEAVHDYCYFPDPDLPPLRLGEELIQRLRDELPEKPFDRQRRYERCYGLPYTLTSVLCPSRALGDFFEAAVKIYNNPRAIANLVANDLLREIGAVGGCWSELRLSPNDLAELVAAVDRGELSKQSAQDVLAAMCHSGERPAAAMERLGIGGSDIDLEKICREAIGENVRATAEFKGGKVAAINALKGAVMGKTAGRADPPMVDATLRRLLLKNTE
ncbi:MAG: Asp-tRNA(Asn)/Glu-tRNA(Gln) amidotransferase subunit GatB [Puniceicoccales bacterium]|jgi:aspartyl-tRNA(Asn)/glutamyl-tRNA(Gln) amidotransferase subunit B|nr:Asp-tRNA(Asn)/Glu-tRNA(Gln) amidotransferase subunit GatB [Puniceicoccales bacterium]